MQALSDLLALLSFVFVLLLFYFVRSLRSGSKRHQQSIERLAQLLPEGERIQEELAALPRSAEDSRFAKWPIVGAWLAQIHINLILLEWKPNSSKTLVILGGGVLVGLMVGRVSAHPFLVSAVAIIASSAALFAFFYASALAKYHKELRLSLPEAIDAITRTCRAGVPISNVFALVHKHLNGPLADEFQLIDHWLKLGVPLKRVMQDSSRRVPLPEYRFFVVILIINNEAGGSLTATLERLTETLRGRIELQLKIQSKTSEARASAKIVASLVPCILGYMYLNSPEDFRFLLEDPIGNGVLGYTIASVLLGLSITFAMVRRVR